MNEATCVLSTCSALAFWNATAMVGTMSRRRVVEMKLCHNDAWEAFGAAGLVKMRPLVENREPLPTVEDFETRVVEPRIATG